jgi:hypothetical protein
MRAQLELVSPGADPEASLDVLRAAVAARRAAGQILGLASDAAVLSQKLIEAHRFPEARALLDSLVLPPGAPSEAIYHLAFQRSLLARFSGDLRVARVELEKAAQVARRTGLGRTERVAVDQVRALLLSTLGRFEEAGRAFEPLFADLPGEKAGCDWEGLLTNLGWTLYLAKEAGEELGDPVPLFERVRTILVEKPCEDRQQKRFNAELNLALAYLQRGPGDLARAAAALEAAKALRASATPLQRLWWLHAEGLLALERGSPLQALSSFDRLERQAKAFLSLQEQWRAAFGKARAFVALNDPERAAHILRAADELLDEQLASIPIDAGRESFLDQWEAGSRLLVDLWLRLDRPAEAFRAARIARARLLRSLASAERVASLGDAERRSRDQLLDRYWMVRLEIEKAAADDWLLESDALERALEARAERNRDLLALLERSLPRVSAPQSGIRSELPLPRSGELTLAYFPLAARGEWVRFAQEGTRILARRFVLPAGNPSDGAVQANLSRVLLEQLDAEIAAARSLRILAYGQIRAVSFHALPFKGDILLAAKPVAYGLDIASSQVRAGGRRLKALVVSDPQGTLREARLEGDDVESSLKGSGAGWRVQRLPGEAATASALHAALHDGVDLFHYAGHADFSGLGGWESQIPLAGRGRLTLGDVLSLDRSPAWVVLSGCETGQTDGKAQVESQGLAQSFLLAGSVAVVAATRKVGDQAAHELVIEMYREMSGPPDLPTLLQQAQLRLRQRLPAKDWEGFRAFVP